LSGLTPERIYLVELFNSKIHKEFKLDDAVSSIRDADLLVAYEIHPLPKKKKAAVEGSTFGRTHFN